MRKGKGWKLIKEPGTSPVGNPLAGILRIFDI